MPVYTPIQGRPWHIASPTLFRYMDKRYVDEFFEEGSLRLSSFATFKKHEDEQRLDKKEGHSDLTIYLTYPNGETYTVLAKIEAGRDAYVLCAAMRHDSDLMKRFECDSYIRINNPIHFAEIVAKKIAAFRHGIEGACHYVAHKRVQCNVTNAERLDLVRTPQDSPEFFPLLQRLILQKAEHFPLFMKDQSYAHQTEYRLLWATAAPVEGIIDIKVPEAREFCARPSMLD